MAIEIERKFLVKNELWKAQVQSEKTLKQGYFTEGGERSIRVRTNNGQTAFLNIKQKLNKQGTKRLEFEYEIPYADAEMMLEQVVIQPIIDKTRYKVLNDGMIWDLDIFAGENQGLMIAEIELEDIDQSFQIPAWAGEEVSNDMRYYNMNLIKHPFSQW